MRWLWVMAAAAFGAAAISYVQLVGDRTTSAGALARLRTRSRCPRCAAVLRARDLLPVLGFLRLRGRCRQCQATIPRRHLLAELATASWWAAAVGLIGLAWWLPLLLLVPCLAVVLLTAAVQAAECRWLAVAVLPPSGVAVLTVGLGAALQGRWLLYAGCGALGAAALLATVLMTREQSREEAPSRS